MEASTLSADAPTGDQANTDGASTSVGIVAVEAPHDAPSDEAESRGTTPLKAAEAERCEVTTHVPREEPRAVDASQVRAMQQDDGVHAMLATAAARQMKFQELRDASLDIGLRDMRKCDYPITPVPRVPSARRPSARRGGRISEQANETNRGDTSTSSETSIVVESNKRSDDSEGFVWKHHLEAHVAHVLVELRRRPDELRALLASQYPKGRTTTQDESSENDTVEEEQSQVRRVSSAGSPAAKSHRLRRPFLSAKDVYAKLTEVGFKFGEAIYLQIRKMLLKSIKSGVIDRTSNLIRLESMFKVELRRQVTLERLQHAVLSKLDMNHKLKPQGWMLQETIRGEPNALDQDQSTQSETNPDRQDEDPPDAEVMTVTTAHHFKMQALERVLAGARRSNKSERHDSSVASLPRLRSDQLADQIQDKVTATVYSKNRENFPFWKDPPESGLSREETTKLLRTVTCALANVSAFTSLTVEQLIEITKSTRWKTLSQGTTICTKGAPIDNFFVIMEGSVSPEEGTATASSNVLQVSNRFDDHRSIDSSLGPGRICHGELGLLSKTELWPSTLSVTSGSARILTLSRESFDSVLSRIFGGAKRSVIARDGNVGKRPTSSPAATRIQGRSAPRLATSSIREQAVAKFQQYRDEYVNRVPEEAPEHENEELIPEKQQTRVLNETKSSSTIRPSPPASSVYQHYPTFPVVDSGSAGSHMFRLKCIQPIAFGMKSVGEVIQDEWAPAFPDTSTLVDYMAAAESSFLFEKRNVLIKENLRAVCTNVPFQDDLTMRSRADEYLSYYQDNQADSITQESALANASASFTDSINASAPIGSSGASAYAIATTVDSDPMTLGQFADARRRISSKIGASSGGAGSQSMRNVFASAATSATLAKHGNAPFVNSCFVPESSFHDDLRNFMSSQEITDEKDDDDLATGNENAAKVSVHPEVDEEDDTSSHVTSEHSASAGDLGTSTSPTKARKMALDSIINTMTDRSPVKRKMTDHEAARRVILQKHLYAANEGASPSSKPADGRKRSLLQTATLNQNAEDTSHGPLPLRVDLQRRMETVLAALKMKPKTKLDLVLKYTHADFYDHFPDAVVLWEQAAHYVLKREKALDALRTFELVASDPRRHFRSLSTHRLTEQKERDALFYQLNYASDLCRESLDELEKRCGDVVYLENRPYREKMKKDYTELLFEVEQERLRMIYKGIHPVVSDTRPGSKGNDAQGNQREDSVSRRGGERQHAPARVVSGSSSILTEPRFNLSTPRESIYVSVVNRIAQEEREEREQLAKSERMKAQRPLHKLSAQVRQHRQAQLDGMISHTPGSNDRVQGAHSKPEAEQLRAATPAVPVAAQTSVATTLKQALESALSRR